MSKCIVKLNIINTIIIILLIILVIINGEYLRPQFRYSQFLNTIFGSLPNFVGSFIIFIMILSTFIKKIVAKNEIGNLKYLLIIFGFLVFLFLTIEEYFPFFTGSKTFDIYDIIANIVGVSFAYIFFVLLTNRCLKKSTVL
ncbi:MAG: hypothetical protein CSA39_05160 [Flavobacteriales bacterium]|nr:MAG: hypothetical protein CSA39_05160 [Flavobacteriales bacterium]